MKLELEKKKEKISNSSTYGFENLNGWRGREGRGGGWEELVKSENVGNERAGEGSECIVCTHGFLVLEEQSCGDAAKKVIGQPTLKFSSVVCTIQSGMKPSVVVTSRVMWNETIFC